MKNEKRPDASPTKPTKSTPREIELGALEASRREAKARLEDLARSHPAITSALVSELTLETVAIGRATRHAADQNKATAERLSVYIAALEQALLARQSLGVSNASWICRKFGHDALDCFEVTALKGMIAAARDHLNFVTLPKVDKNEMASSALGKRAAIRRTANICQRHGIQVSASQESLFYEIVRATLGSASPGTIRAALGRQ